MYNAADVWQGLNSQYMLITVPQQPCNVFNLFDNHKFKRTQPIIIEGPTSGHPTAIKLIKEVQINTLDGWQLHANWLFITFVEQILS